MSAAERRAALERAGVEFVVLDFQRASPQLTAFVEAMEMQPFGSDEHRVVFTVRR